MAEPVSEYQDIQGILLTGYGKLEEACFLLLRIKDLDAAKAWLAAIVEDVGAKTLPYRVTHAGDLASQPKRALQIAFTASGLKELGVPKALFCGGALHTFPREFRLGMAGEGDDREGRTRRLGDVGQNAPSHWKWGGAQTQTFDVLVMLYAEAGSLAAFQQMVMVDLASGFEVFKILDTAKAVDEGNTRREPFGFVDGISQPKIDWNAQRKTGTRADLEYRNLIAPGEFLLGYENEYGLYTDRPLLDPKLDPENILSPAENDPDMRDLGRNGSYLVFRQLEQDVSGFWDFVHKASPADGGVSLAEAMVGRRLSTGDPLITAPRGEISGVGPKPQDISQNRFTFEADPKGLSCPFGAHIRRSNPRTADLPGGKQGWISWLLRTLGLKRGDPRNDLISASRFHRIIRRGRPYGVAIGHRKSVLRGETPGDPTGIYFIALNANISRQFEFIQNAWLVSTKFNGMDRETDPLIGNRVPFPGGHCTDTFSLPQHSGPNRRIAGLPQFVTVRGGAYFFLPSLRALRFFARQSVEDQGGTLRGQ